MCDERERLIAYVYGEAATRDREQIEVHLGECHVCRTEVSGLRGVRDDLLAWDVPTHDPIWRPVAAVPAVPVRRSWPVWALATAAGAVFAAGLAGGIVAREWSAGLPPPASAASTAVPTSQPHVASTVTANDLAELETVILERLRAEMAQQIRANAPAPTAAAVPTRVGNQTGTSELEDRLAAVERWRDDQISLNVLFNGNFGRLNRSTSSLSEQIEMSRMQLVGLEGAAR